MSALEFMRKELDRNKKNLFREFERNAPDDVIENIEKKIGYYDAACEALELFGQK